MGRGNSQRLGFRHCSLKGTFLTNSVKRLCLKLHCPIAHGPPLILGSAFFHVTPHKPPFPLCPSAHNECPVRKLLCRPKDMPESSLCSSVLRAVSKQTHIHMCTHKDMCTHAFTCINTHIPIQCQHLTLTPMFPGLTTLPRTLFFACW